MRPNPRSFPYRLHELERPEDFEPCPPLLKGMQLAGKSLAPAKKCRKKNRRNKDWKGSAVYCRFVDLYRRFVQEVVLPEFCSPVGGDGDEVEAVVQMTPIMRVVMPSANVATVPHRDADYGHVPEELNFWMPLTPVWGSRAVAWSQA